jgi:methionyl-tRNA synthetase
MPGASARIAEVIGSKVRPVWEGELDWGGSLEGSRVAESLVLFPRPAPKP